jgi:hypothetical protein
VRTRASCCPEAAAPIFLLLRLSGSNFFCFSVLDSLIAALLGRSARLREQSPAP